jgi:phosphopantetheine adenylyltransferase
MKTYYSAVLHLRNKDYLSVSQLGGRVSINLTANKTVFTDPDPTVEEIDAAVAKLIALINSKNGSKQQNQAIADQAGVVHELLKTECI